MIKPKTKQEVDYQLNFSIQLTNMYHFLMVSGNKFSSMKKYIFIFILALLASPAIIFAQVNDPYEDAEISDQNLFDSLYIEGVREFDKKHNEQDFNKAVLALEEAVNLKPTNASAHYYLSYAYSELNKQKTHSSAYRDKNLTIKSSEQMEKVLKINPAFPPKLILSPNSKITSEWAALALYYYINNNLDSAFWAFTQGRNRGGFSKFMLNVRRTQLDQCPKNSILFSKGDDNTYIFLYLQVIENYRTDIAVIDLDLLNSPWYQLMLNQRSIVDIIPVQRNSKGYKLVNWSDTIVEIPIHNTNRIYSWYFEARGNSPYYLYYGDQAVLSIISRNKFRRPVLFTNGIPNIDYHNLWPEIRDEILSKRIAPFDQKRLSLVEFDANVKSILNNIQYYNNNCYDEQLQINDIRRSILTRIYLDWLSSVDVDKENARYLLNLLTEKLPAEKYPYIDQEIYTMIKDFDRVILQDTVIR